MIKDVEGKRLNIFFYSKIFMGVHTILHILLDSNYLETSRDYIKYWHPSLLALGGCSGHPEDFTGKSTRGSTCTERNVG